jgi:hypothetical protein
MRHKKANPGRIRIKLSDPDWIQTNDLPALKRDALVS